MCDPYILKFQVWGVNSLVYYAEEMAAGRPLPKPYENVHDDPQQVMQNHISPDKHIFLT